MRAQDLGLTRECALVYGGNRHPHCTFRRRCVYGSDKSANLRAALPKKLPITALDACTPLTRFAFKRLDTKLLVLHRESLNGAARPIQRGLKLRLGLRAVAAEKRIFLLSRERPCGGGFAGRHIHSAAFFYNLTVPVDWPGPSLRLPQSF